MQVSATNLIADAIQPDNPAGPATQSQEWIEETLFTLPAGSEVFDRAAGLSSNAPVALQRVDSGYRLSEAVPVRRTVQKRSAATVGASQKDEGRALGVRFQAMKPLQWTGIALCAASIAAFYFGWASIGFMALAVGGGMIVVAAVMPGHEILILAVGGIGLAVASVLVVYAYHKGHFDANKNGIPDFLERKV